MAMIAAPFVGPGGWFCDEFELTRDLARGCRQVRGCMCLTDSRTGPAPPSHATLCAGDTAGAGSPATGRDHQVNNDLSKDG